MLEMNKKVDQQLYQDKEYQKLCSFLKNLDSLIATLKFSLNNIRVRKAI